ncbi:LacI family DNA-binding transcriptional regulator [Scatolibacter rhodanostii]|uniref:LacI family DNA-binding transcriptional regulator n=1 Tax=Scatolibacter rhodanostii TaxID=2014781 RepID=UPI000C08A806|nr:LacI family DNA-binding transcriptional regulator [Scatolibacter rhodanostii]
MATLKDIAQKAGVTTTTVSRVINNRGYISEQTRAKVFQVMEELNYHPNELARALAKKHNSTIGVIVPHISHPFFANLISNLESSAMKKGYKILLCNSKDKQSKEMEYLEMCISNRVAGIILCSKYVDAKKFSKLNIPIVNLEQEDSFNAISIQCDNYEGGRMAAQHLISCGCKKILHFGGIAGKNMPADQRAQGFTDVCESHKVLSKVVLTDQSAYGTMNYHGVIESVLEENRDADGIFASSDLIAAQVVQVCNAMDIKVPEDVCLVGFDDVYIAQLTTPTITSIHQPIRKMAELSIDCIDKTLNGEVVPSKITLPVTLIKRNSTKID